MARSGAADPEIDQPVGPACARLSDLHGDDDRGGSGTGRSRSQSIPLRYSAARGWRAYMEMHFTQGGGRLFPPAYPYLMVR